MLKINTIQKRINIWGITRSGIHGISGWIYDSHTENKLYLDDQIFGEEPESDYGFLIRDYGITQFNREKIYSSLDNIKKWREEKKNNLLLMVYENHDLSCDKNDKLSENVLGRSSFNSSVLILRDIFNHYASFNSIKPEYIKYAQEIKKSNHNFEQVNGYPVGLWKMYAKEYIGETNLLPNKTVINFNKWTTNSDYRLDIAEKLSFNCTDEPYSRVSSSGGGSSFDGQMFDGKAQEMKVLKRWSLIPVADRGLLLDYIKNDQELIDLINQIYPKSFRELI